MADTRFKICCIQDEAEARLAIGSGASAIGLVSRMPSGPGPISIEQITTIVRSLFATGHIVDMFLLTCEIEYGKIRAALPHVKIVQVIHVEGEFSLDEAFRAQQHVDALLLDSGRPGAAIKELGGTGRAHDWTLSRRIVGQSKVPVYLAGGLTPDNAAIAIRDVGPYALDVCSGVRTDGKLDPAKLDAFAKAIASA